MNSYEYVKKSVKEEKVFKIIEEKKKKRVGTIGDRDRVYIVVKIVI